MPKYPETTLAIFWPTSATVRPENFRLAVADLENSNQVRSSVTVELLPMTLTFKFDLDSVKLN